MKKAIVIAVLMTITMWVAQGCATIEGLGEDISNASRGIQNAERNK